MTFSNSSLGSAISIGTAVARPISPHKPHLTNVWGPAMGVHSRDLSDPYRLPSPPSVLSPASPLSQDTIGHLRQRPGHTEKRRSIIDPSTVRVSFVGSITDLSQPMAMPLEEGLQKLYKLCEQNSRSEVLPHNVQITDIPLDRIADSLETHITEQNAALQDCALNIQNLNLTNDRTKQDLIALEFQYCIARQQANLRSMTSDDTRLRLAWMKEEIKRLNIDKENALKASMQHQKDNERLSKDLHDVVETKQENSRLTQENLQCSHEVKRLTNELDETKREIDRLHFVMNSVPSAVQRLCARLLVPDKKKRQKENLLILDHDTPPPSPKTQYHRTPICSSHI